MSIRSEAVKRRRKKVKAMAVAYKGGACMNCGYSNYIGSLEFHHTDPSQKDFSLSTKGHCRSWNSVMIELDKTVLLCSNCHKEIHANLIDLDLILLKSPSSEEGLKLVEKLLSEFYS